jgi:uncharacterized protein YkwD
VTRRLAFLCAAVIPLLGCAVTPHSARVGPLPGDRSLARDDFDGPLLARAIFGATNRVRAEHGLRSLGSSADLDSAADEQASHLVMIAGVEHTNPFPGEATAAERVARTGLEAQAVGENALMMPAAPPPGAADPGYTYSTYAAFLLQTWMDSPGHRANILRRGFQFLGCAARLGRGPRRNSDRIYAVQVFFLPDVGQGDLGRPSPD